MSTDDPDDPGYRSYYGQPILKEPAWKVPDVPLYLFLGGTAGTSAALGVLGGFTARPGLYRAGTLVAAGGAVASVVALIHDLGRPERFLNMMRVLKVTSPLSVGSWILSPFSGLAGAAAASELTGIAPRLGRLAAVGAGVLGPAMCTYTAVLVADTAVPSWHEPFRELPFLFAGSAMTSGAGAMLLCAPRAETAPARRLAVLGTAVELVAERRISHGHGLASEPWRTKRAGRLLTTAKALTVAGAATGLLAGRSRIAAVASGTALLAAGLCTRFGAFDAGVESTRDPKYVVVPQRERLAAREG